MKIKKENELAFIVGVLAAACFVVGILTGMILVEMGYALFNKL